MASQSRIADLYEENLTDDDMNFIENSTIGQSVSLAWKQVRIGRITASVVHDVLHTNQQHPAKPLILKICSQGKLLQAPSLLWGTENESQALKTYQEHLQMTHRNVVIKRSGIRLHKNYHMLGASADGIGKCDSHGDFLIEIKCPFKFREKNNVRECLEDSNFCLDAQLDLKEDHRYMNQVQMQMYIYEVAVCHFVIWAPNFFHSPKVFYDKKFENEIEVLLDFHKAHIAKELTTREIELGKGMDSKEEEESRDLVCICQQPEEGEMIGCDNPSCKYRWFHFKCIQMKRAPKNDWFCKECRREKRKKNKQGLKYEGTRCNSS